MTTPAINRNEESRQRLPRSLWLNGQFVSRDLLSAETVGWEAEARPESVSHPINKSTGWRSPTAWYHSSTKTKHPPRGEAITQFFSAYQWHYENGCGMGRAPAGVNTALENHLENRALTKALERLKSQDFNIGVFMGEARETIQLFNHALSRVVSDVRNFKKAHIADWHRAKKYQTGKLVKRKASRIPEGWLEMQYGWIPLMADVQGACKALNKGAQVTVPRVKVTGFARDHGKFPTRVYSTHGGGSRWCDIELVQESFCKVVLYYDLKSAADVMKTRLGATNALEIVWELTPWSFVSDWFSSVGQWLGVADADRGWDFVSGTCSKKSIADERIRGHGFGNFSGADYVYSSDQVCTVYDYTSFSRVIYDSSPRPGLYVKGPLSVGHSANLLALLISNFR